MVGLKYLASTYLGGVILSGARQRDMPVFVQVYPAIVILNAVKNPCILPEVP